MSESISENHSGTVGLGSLVGRYRVEHLLGSGGMADVFYAMHEDLHRPAAIKVLKASLATDETNLQRFLNEARSAASLIHPNIVQVYDVGRDGEVNYIAQEFIPGTNLRQFLAASSQPTDVIALAGEANRDSSNSPPEVRDPTTGDRQLPLPIVLSILLQVLAALNKSAASGLVHRDIKPENIMLTEDGDVKVADFGLARTFLGDDPKLTRAGTTLGTPMYMSPEQIQDGTVDIRSDLYSLGVSLYHMLAGRPPFTGETQLALAMKHAQAEVPDITQFRSDLPQSLVDLLDRLLAKDPNDRFATPNDVLTYLQQHHKGDLASIWPEQTVPFPRAGTLNNMPAMQATLALQAALRQRRGRAAQGWLTRIVSVLLVLLAFVAGSALTFSSPLRDVESNSTLYRGVPRQTSAEAQYRFALLNENLKASPEDKWLAVEHFFPKQDGDTNRSYAGMASLQLAWALQKKGDIQAAKNALQATINDPRMDAEYRAYAHITLAIIEDDLGEAANEDQIHQSVDAAQEIWRNIQDPGKQERLRSRLDELVHSKAPERVSTSWFRS